MTISISLPNSKPLNQRQVYNFNPVRTRLEYPKGKSTKTMHNTIKNATSYYNCCQQVFIVYKRLTYLEIIFIKSIAMFHQACGGNCVKLLHDKNKTRVSDCHGWNKITRYTTVKGNRFHELRDFEKLVKPVIDNKSIYWMKICHQKMKNCQIIWEYNIVKT